MVRVGSRVICTAPQGIKQAAPVRPDFGEIYEVSQIVVKHGQPWYQFDALTKKWCFQAKYFTEVKDFEKVNVASKEMMS